MQRRIADYSEAPRGAPASDPVEGSGRAQRGDDAGDAVCVLSARDGTGTRVDRFVATALPQYSRTRIQRWLSLGAVTVDGAQVLPRHRLTGLEQIEVTPLPSEAEQAFEPDPVALCVVHEDSDLMVLDKPPGLVVHPAPGNWRGTLMNGLLHARPDSARLPRAGIVHRLDKDTSGLMMVARTERAFEALVRMLAARDVERHYLALVDGAAAAHLRIDSAIGRDPRDRLRMAVVAPERGKPAVTHCRLLAGARDGLRALSLLECRLETGRTHQIRVHLASRGHPLVGDRLYGGRPCRGFERQALHAWRLRFAHPRTGSVLDIAAPPPADFAQLIESLELGDALRRVLASAEAR